MRQPEAAVAAQGRTEQRRHVAARPADADQQAVARRHRGRSACPGGLPSPVVRRPLPSQGLIEREAGMGGQRQQRDERPGEQGRIGRSANQAVLRSDRLRSNALPGTLGPGRARSTVTSRAPGSASRPCRSAGSRRPCRRSPRPCSCRVLLVGLPLRLLERLALAPRGWGWCVIVVSVGPRRAARGPVNPWTAAAASRRRRAFAVGNDWQTKPRPSLTLAAKRKPARRSMPTPSAPATSR